MGIGVAQPYGPAMSSAARLSGRARSSSFYRREVFPRVASALGSTPHAASHIGDGSDVLGYDDDVSDDHDFGPRVQIVLPEGVDPDPVLAALRTLPTRDGDFPVFFTSSESSNGWEEARPAVTTAAALFTARLGFDPAKGVRLTDWLSTPTQVLATVTAGEVFHDPAGLLTAARDAARWYPDDVWRYVLAAGWLRVEQEEPFVARIGARGDDLASRVVAARLVRDLMRLALLLERRWAPYSKWLGRAYAEVSIAPLLTPLLAAALSAEGWRDRERAVHRAAAVLFDALNGLGLAGPINPDPIQFYDRDIRVSPAGEAVTGLIRTIQDPEILTMIDSLGGRMDGLHRLPGAVDQAVDSVDVLTYPRMRRAVGKVLGRPDTL